MHRFLTAAGRALACAASAAALLAVPAAGQAGTLVSQLGTRVINLDTGLPVQDGEYLPPNSFVVGDPYPFDFPGTCQGDFTCADFHAEWTHAYAPVAPAITGAKLEIGLDDVDSAASGNQIGLLTLNGLDLTALLSAAVEAKPYQTRVYGVYDIELPAFTFAALASGSAAFQLRYRGPGLSAFLGEVGDNSGRIDYSTLTITTEAAGPGPVPEPATWICLIGGFGLAGAALRSRRRPPAVAGGPDL